MVVRVWERENGELLLSGHRVSVRGEETVLEVGGGDGRTTV